MKLGIMQPYFMPYLGYFALVKHVDQFILFDTPQFIRHGWIDRNKVLKSNGEPLYIKVPLQKHSSSSHSRVRTAWGGFKTEWTKGATSENPRLRGDGRGVKGGL